jgi:hypothetical protein
LVKLLTRIHKDAHMKKLNFLKLDSTIEKETQTKNLQTEKKKKKKNQKLKNSKTRKNRNYNRRKQCAYKA